MSKIYRKGLPVPTPIALRTPSNFCTSRALNLSMVVYDMGARFANIVVVVVEGCAAKAMGECLVWWVVGSRKRLDSD